MNDPVKKFIVIGGMLIAFDWLGDLNWSVSTLLSIWTLFGLLILLFEAGESRNLSETEGGTE